MSKLALRYVKSYRDRLGVWRHYFNRRGSPSVTLPGLPGSAEFMAAYQQALDDAGLSKPAAPRSAPAEGTMAALIAAYYKSPEFLSVSKSTQATYRNEVEKIRIEHGDMPVAILDRRGVKLLIAAKADKPGAANKLLRTLRMLMRFAIEEELRTDDPTAGVKKLRVPGDGFLAWSEAHIEQFKACHPVGSRARLALALLLYTAQRRGDVIRMGRSHVKGDMIAVRQNKTGTFLDIPIHRDLASILRLAPVGPATFLQTAAGAPFSPAGFGNWFGDCCREAGLPRGYNAHGLRKAAARRLAEAGCTALEIMAITGHKAIDEVERYTRSVSQRHLAEAGMQKLQRSNR